MAIVIENDLMEGLTVIPLSADRLGFFVSTKISEKLQSWNAVHSLAVGELFSGPDGRPLYYKKFIRAAKLPIAPSFTSDSFEAIMAATAHGSIIGVLPLNVAKRSPIPLKEITPLELIKNNVGRHKICLISRQNCDPKENDFLATELKTFMES